MKNKLILFDWGNIVESHETGYSCHDAWDDLFHKCGYTGNEVVFHLLGKYRLSCIQNKTEFEKVYELIKKDFNFHTTYEEFVNIYKEVFKDIDYYQEVADYEVSLRDKCSIGILSDLTIFDKERLARQIDLEKYNYVFLSCDMGLKKPERNIFDKVQSMVPFKSKDILFIDDRLNNIETAKSLGWNTLQATGLELDKIKEKCESFLNEV